MHDTWENQQKKHEDLKPRTVRNVAAQGERNRSGNRKWPHVIEEIHHEYLQDNTCEGPQHMLIPGCSLFKLVLQMQE